MYVVNGTRLIRRVAKAVIVVAAAVAASKVVKEVSKEETTVKEVVETAAVVAVSTAAIVASVNILMFVDQANYWLRHAMEHGTELEWIYDILVERFDTDVASQVFAAAKEAMK